MGSWFSPAHTTIVVALLVVGCASASLPVASDSSPGPSGPSSTPSLAIATPTPTIVPTAPPSQPATPTSTNLGIHAAAREIGELILMAPGGNGTLFVSIPHPDGSILVLLDRTGDPRPGWPITLKGTTSCWLLLPVDDGSVRTVCDGTDLPRFDNDSSGVRAFAMDAHGRVMAGWPVRLRSGFAGSVVRDQLTVIGLQGLTDAVATGVVSHEVWVTTVAADGSIASGEKLPRVEMCCGEEWDVSPDGVAYGTFTVGERDLPGFDEVSQVTALGRSGEQAGWPVTVDGSASGSAFGPDGQIIVTVGRLVQKTSRVVVFDRGGGAVASESGELPIAAGVIVTADGSYECGVPSPIPPIVAHDGTIFVRSEADSAIFALDASLAVRPGWPYRPATSLVYRFSPRSGDLSCGSYATPAVAPDSTLYLPLQARDETVGGSLAAVGPDGRVRPGWQVELNRSGAEFWSVVVGSDGTVFALAVEPEAGDTSSASILAIAPDSTVLSITTILEP